MELILYGHSGESFPIDDREWDELVASAASQGWNPSVTVAEPIRLDADAATTSSQCPLSSRPRQTVVRQDAKALAAALRLAGHSKGNLRERFISFCERGGFLICPTPEGIHLGQLGQELDKASGGDKAQSVAWTAKHLSLQR